MRQKRKLKRESEETVWERNYEDRKENQKKGKSERAGSVRMAKGLLQKGTGILIYVKQLIGLQL